MKSKEEKNTEALHTDDESVKIDKKSERKIKKDLEKIGKKVGQRVKKSKSFFKDISDFIKAKDIVGVAIAFILGVSFRAIITSLVGDLIMPLVAAIGGVAVEDWVVVLNYSADGTPNILYYGRFIQTIIDFIIVAISIFFALKLTKNVQNAMSKGALSIKGKMEKRNSKSAASDDEAEVDNNNDD